MSSVAISSEVADAGVRFHHQDDIGNGNDDDEATVMGVSSTLDAGDDTLTSSSSERNTSDRFYTNTSSSLYTYTSYLDRNRSTTSYTTECTNDTTRISNISRRQTATGKENKNFLLFIKILMKLIGEKDLNLFRKAQTIIRDYKQRKQRGEIESFVENICSPLKDSVGLQYWNQAKELLHCHRKPKMTSIISLKSTEMMTTSESSTLQSATKIPMSYVCHRGLKEGSLIHKSKMSTFESIVTTTNNNNIGGNKEMRTRKKRLWMIISIFMQYLQRKHTRLYLEAKSLVNECVEIHRCSKYDGKCSRTSNNSSLSASIQSCLKTEIGIDHWRRAENYVAKVLLKQHNDKGNKSKNNALGSVERIHHSTTNVKKRQRASSDEIYNNETKRLCF
mmetsp:Transcript_52057/g.58150  ORF Transcript_52057/g.58150 Transcript_52057/m.58150 type:complete len:391 (+) Transcript_52057:117-1289(+)